mgnify:CR=1 FL=1
MAAFFALTLLLCGVSAPADAGQEQTPNEAVAAMNGLLVKKDFAGFYKEHCHKHLRDQIDEAKFVELLKGERGGPMLTLFAEVQAAIKDKKGEDVLASRQNGDEYEYAVVRVAKLKDRKGAQWHLELMKEDGKWKLKDTD